MSKPMDIQGQLNKLTPRQCQILYWVCHDWGYAEIGKKVGLSESGVTKQMTRIYELFDLDYLDRNPRRARLYQTVCPVLLAQVIDPETDCSGEVIDPSEDADPDPKVLALVVRDAKEKNIPRDHSLVARAKYSLIGTPASAGSRGNTGLGILVGVLGTLLVLAIVAIIMLLVGGGNRFPPPFQPPSAPVAQVVQTVIVAQPGPSPLIQTVIVTAAPTVGPSPIVQTVVATLMPSTPTPGVLDVAGKVPSDIPGMKLDLGSTVYSVVAYDSKPRDIYAIALKAGRPLYLDAFVQNGCVFIYIYNPGSSSIVRTQYSQATYLQACGEKHDIFTPAISGTYYIGIEPSGITGPYTLHIDQPR